MKNITLILRKVIYILALLLLSFTFQSDDPPGWFELSLPINDQVNDIYFTDTLTGWAVTLGDNSPVDTAYVLHTTDGGSNWIIQYYHINNFVAVQFIDTTLGYVFGGVSFPKFYKTTNGGTDWIDLSAGLPIGSSSDMQFINKDTGWICSDPPIIGGLAKTTNGGTTWQLQLGESYLPKKVFFINADTGWVLGSGNNLYRSTNGGNNWSVQYHSNHQLVDVLFINENTGFLSGFFGFGSYSIKKTTDGGFSWDSTNNSIGGLDIFFVNSSTGYNTGNLSTMQKTTDGGNNWYDQTVPSGNYKCIYFLDTLIGYAGGTKTIKTTNGGGPVSNIKQLSNKIPQGFKLYQNYPNPFNPNTIIKFNIKKTSDVSLKVYDISGRLIDGIFYKNVHTGEYHYEFDGTGLTSGVYFYSLIIEGNIIDTKKMLLIK